MSGRILILVSFLGVIPLSFQPSFSQLKHPGVSFGRVEGKRVIFHIDSRLSAKVDDRAIERYLDSFDKEAMYKTTPFKVTPVTETVRKRLFSLIPFKKGDKFTVHFGGGARRLGKLVDVSWYAWLNAETIYRLQGILEIKGSLPSTNFYNIGDERFNGQYVLVTPGDTTSLEPDLEGPEGFLAFNEFDYDARAGKEVFEIVQRYEYTAFRLINDHFKILIIIDEFAR